MFDALPPVPPSCTGGKALGGGAPLSPAGQNQPALGLAPYGLPEAALASHLWLSWQPHPSSPRKPVGSSTARAQDAGDSWGPGRDSRTSQVCSQRPPQPDGCRPEAPRARAQGHRARGPSSVSVAHPGRQRDEPCGSELRGLFLPAPKLPRSGVMLCLNNRLSPARTDTPSVRTLGAQHRGWHTVGPQRVSAD